jgi:hypothetical protein
MSSFGSLETRYNNIQNESDPFSNINPDTSDMMICPYNGETCAGANCMAAITSKNPMTMTRVFEGCSLLFADYRRTQSVKEIENNIVSMKNTLNTVSEDVEYIKEFQENYSLEIRDQIDEVIEELKTTSEIIEHNFSEFIPEVKKMYELSAHIHFTHRHPIPHNADVIDPYITISEEQYVGSRFIYTMAPATYLLQEWINNCDLDGDGKVYGFDFVIPNKDKNKPMVIKGIESSATWKTPKTREHFNVYMNRVYGHNIKDPGLTYTNALDNFHTGDGGYTPYIPKENEGGS